MVAVSLVLLISSLLVAILAVAAVALAGQQARTAADLAALAAAGEVISGVDHGRACAQAGLVAEENDATLVSCTVASTDGRHGSGVAPRTQVEVSREVLGGRFSVTALAAATGVVPRG